MSTTVKIEVFADMNCPFTHVGLQIVTAELASRDTASEVWVRAWPLEWVNGVPLDAASVLSKARVLRHELRIGQFSGIDTAQWPGTTIPALNLAADAYGLGPELGLRVSLSLRDALFERGQDIGDPQFLARFAAANGLPAPSGKPSEVVLADYAEGRRRGVTGSPDFYVENEEFFCPSLDIGHDDSGHLTAGFDGVGLRRFLATVVARAGEAAT